MKLKLTLLFLLSLTGYLTSNAQDKILTHQQLLNPEYLKTLENEENIKAFITSTGDTVSINDIVVFGKPSQDRPVFNSLVNKEVNNYTTIFHGKPLLKTITKFQYFPEGYEGKKAKVKEIIAQKPGKKHPALIMIALELTENNLSNIDITAVTHSFNVLELKVIGGKLTKNEALNKLKEAKQNLDLELISQEEYDTIKDELSPYIMN